MSRWRTCYDKDEFDVLVLDKKVCIHHNTYEQWEKIAQYLVNELGMRSAVPVKNHNFRKYQYTYLRHGTIFSNISSPESCQVLTFEQFWDAVTGDEPEFRCSLEDVL